MWRVSYGTNGASNHERFGDGRLFFGVAPIRLFVLLIVEKYFRYREFFRQGRKAPFKTNAGAFPVNDMIMTILPVSGLVIVASNCSSFGSLGGFADGPAKGIAGFLLFDVSVFLWHYLGHKYAFRWRFHKIYRIDKSDHVTTGLRFHTLDEAQDVFVNCIRVALFGVPAYVVVVCELVRMFFVLFHRGNFILSREKYLSCVVITSFLLRAHHSTPGDEHDSNHGIVLSVRDWLFGTRKIFVPKSIRLEMIGAENIVRCFSLAFLTGPRLAKLLYPVPGHGA